MAWTHELEGIDLLQQCGDVYARQSHYADEHEGKRHDEQYQHHERKS